MAAEGVTLFLQTRAFSATPLDFAETVRQLLEEGWTIEPEDLARIWPYLTEHINRFGEYSTHELGIQPEVSDRSWTWTALRCESTTSRRPASVRPPDWPGPGRRQGHPRIVMTWDERLGIISNPNTHKTWSSPVRGRRGR